MRLEKEPCLFSAKEIIVRVDYKYCPNLTIIDTPGLIAPAPGPKNRALQVVNLLIIVLNFELKCCSCVFFSGQFG